MSESPRRHARELEGEIESLRGELGDLVSELDRRRHELLDLRLQLRRHPVAFGVAGVSVVLVLGGAVAVMVNARERRRRPTERARRLGKALSRMIDAPHKVAREPSVGEKILAAAGTAAASILVKRLMDRATAPVARAAREAREPRAIH
ncbi:hypothetical protein [Anaeromyxobacter paludicola]|uniref:DUF3618 domain-containing protein n=1 Tax=Anaeromyxobacter paludicola TaxID=2918171 RepID=A0ABM7X9A2_9BACT|nr:hypothetical protein [Anaeromyxobacter paludicola]BDG08407.1 hypothetical protein AMPC_15200 [Anaeromyxobacter paludicola]